MSEPLAYLITWTTYGTWLPGDERGWVEKGRFEIQPGNLAQSENAQTRMKGSRVTLDAPQRTAVEATIRAHCQIRGWKLHALNARSNHVHAVVAANVRPEEVMNQFKAWCSRRLNEHAGSSPVGNSYGTGIPWWTKYGSTKWINDEGYLLNAIRYVLEGQ